VRWQNPIPRRLFQLRRLGIRRRCRHFPRCGLPLITNIGGWMASVATAWLMTSLDPSSLDWTGDFQAPAIEHLIQYGDAQGRSRRLTIGPPSRGRPSSPARKRSGRCVWQMVLMIVVEWNLRRDRLDPQSDTCLRCIAEFLSRRLRLRPGGVARRYGLVSGAGVRRRDPARSSCGRAQDLRSILGLR